MCFVKLIFQCLVQMGLKEDDYQQGFLGFKLQVERIFKAVIGIVELSVV